MTEILDEKPSQKDLDEDLQLIKAKLVQELNYLVANLGGNVRAFTIIDDATADALINKVRSSEVNEKGNVPTALFLREQPNTHLTTTQIQSLIDDIDNLADCSTIKSLALQLEDIRNKINLQKVQNTSFHVPSSASGKKSDFYPKKILTQAINFVRADIRLTHAEKNMSKIGEKAFERKATLHDLVHTELMATVKKEKVKYFDLSLAIKQGYEERMQFAFNKFFENKSFKKLGLLEKFPNNWITNESISTMAASLAFAKPADGVQHFLKNTIPNQTKKDLDTLKSVLTKHPKYCEGIISYFNQVTYATNSALLNVDDNPDQSTKDETSPDLIREHKTNSQGNEMTDGNKNNFSTEDFADKTGHYATQKKPNPIVSTIDHSSFPENKPNSKRNSVTNGNENGKHFVTPHYTIDTNTVSSRNSTRLKNSTNSDSAASKAPASFIEAVVDFLNKDMVLAKSKSPKTGKDWITLKTATIKANEKIFKYAENPDNLDREIQTGYENLVTEKLNKLIANLRKQGPESTKELSFKLTNDSIAQIPSAIETSKKSRRQAIYNFLINTGQVKAEDAGIKKLLTRDDLSKSCGDIINYLKQIQHGTDKRKPFFKIDNKSTDASPQPEVKKKRVSFKEGPQNPQTLEQDYVIVTYPKSSLKKPANTPPPQPEVPETKNFRASSTDSSDVRVIPTPFNPSNDNKVVSMPLASQTEQPAPTIASKQNPKNEIVKSPTFNKGDAEYSIRIMEFTPPKDPNISTDSPLSDQQTEQTSTLESKQNSTPPPTSYSKETQGGVSTQVDSNPITIVSSPINKNLSETQLPRVETATKTPDSDTLKRKTVPDLVIETQKPGFERINTAKKADKPPDQPGDLSRIQTYKNKGDEDKPLSTPDIKSSALKHKSATPPKDEQPTGLTSFFARMFWNLKERFSSTPAETKSMVPPPLTQIRTEKTLEHRVAENKSPTPTVKQLSSGLKAEWATTKMPSNIDILDNVSDQKLFRAVSSGKKTEGKNPDVKPKNGYFNFFGIANSNKQRNGSPETKPSLVNKNRQNTIKIADNAEQEQPSQFSKLLTRFSCVFPTRESLVHYHNKKSVETHQLEAETHQSRTNT